MPKAATVRLSAASKLKKHRQGRRQTAKTNAALAMPGQLPKIAELAMGMPQVVECHRITGEDCFILKIHIDALESLDGVLDRFLAYGQTTTSIVQSSPVPLRAPPLPNEV